MTLICDFCHKDSGGFGLFLINPAGGHGGRPEMWACVKCLRDAEEGSIMADMRDRLYADDVRSAILV